MCVLNDVILTCPPRPAWTLSSGLCARDGATPNCELWFCAFARYHYMCSITGAWVFYLSTGKATCLWNKAVFGPLYRATNRENCHLANCREAIMKSCLSLLAALLVMVLLAAAGYWAYQKNTGPANPNGHLLTAVSGGTSLTLTNATAYVLTVTMRQGASLVRFQLAPGKSETRTFPPGTYSVDGNLSDPSTEPFSSQWSFQSGGKYNANFTRDGQAVKVRSAPFGSRRSVRKLSNFSGERAIVESDPTQATIGTACRWWRMQDKR